jgi:hypothetical protein
MVSWSNAHLYTIHISTYQSLLVLQLTDQSISAAGLTVYRDVTWNEQFLEEFQRYSFVRIIFYALVCSIMRLVGYWDHLVRLSV